MAGRPRRVAGDRLHDHLDDPVAGGGVHPGAVHGRHPRAAVPRVRRDHQRGDSDLRVRVADPDADAVQPFPRGRPARAAWHAVLCRLGAGLRWHARELTSWSLNGSCGIVATHADRLGGCSSPPPCISSIWFPRASSPARTRNQINASTEVSQDLLRH